MHQLLKLSIGKPISILQREGVLTNSIQAKSDEKVFLRFIFRAEAGRRMRHLLQDHQVHAGEGAPG